VLSITFELTLLPFLTVRYLALCYPPVAVKSRCTDCPIPDLLISSGHPTANIQSHIIVSRRRGHDRKVVGFTMY